MPKVTKLTKPCSNCPFLKVGAIPLRRGRLAQIIRDHERGGGEFYCHKTTHGKGSYINESDEYYGNGKEAHCAGIDLFFYKTGRTNQMMRIRERIGLIPEGLMKHANLVIDHDPN